jgi:hypothetical protein
MTSNDCKTDWEEALNSLAESANSDEGAVAGWEIEIVRRRVKAAIQEARAPIQITDEIEHALGLCLNALSFELNNAEQRNDLMAGNQIATAMKAARAAIIQVRTQAALNKAGG